MEPGTVPRVPYRCSQEEHFMSELLNVEHLKKVYTTRFHGASVQALEDVTFSVEEGEYVAIMGESGSGKTTLLNILASLDRPTSGKVLLKGKDTTAIKDREITAFRRDHLGFVFQDFNLLDTFDIRDNILLPLVLQQRPVKEMEEKLTKTAASLGITDILNKQIYECSGGQKQRAAIARALITDPDILLADEPTGSLDSRSSDQILKIFGTINRAGQTILMVTHSTIAASHASRVMFIKDGQIFHQIYRGDSTDQEMYDRIQSTLAMLSRNRDHYA